MDEDKVYRNVDDSIKNMYDYLNAIAEMISHVDTDWEKVYVFIESLGDELEDARNEVWNFMDDEPIEV